MFSFRLIKPTVLTGFLVTTSFFISSCQLIDNQNGNFVVDEIIDGDTYKINGHTYRLLGADTAETYDNKNNFQPTTGAQYFYGSWAKNRATQLIKNQKVQVDTIKQDKYKRSIARISIDNQDLSTLLISEGLAVIRYISTIKNDPFYYSDQAYVENLWNAQKLAKHQNKGIWQESKTRLESIFPGYKFKWK